MPEKGNQSRRLIGILPGRAAFGVAPLGFILLSLAISYGFVCPTARAANPAEWRLIWSDEFNGRRGPTLDSKKWSFDVGGGGWGNNELESYTNRSVNAKVQDGVLVIRVLKETFTGPDNVTRNYTSARILTKNKFTQTYGRFEARIKLPYGQGIWPAFWMLGYDLDTAGWPSCGEIDIMEYIGREPSLIHGTIHGPGYSGAKGITASYKLSQLKESPDDYHTFAVEWEPGVIRFYVDKQLYKTRTPADLPAGKAWVFNHPFFLVINVAVGGDFPGNPDATTAFPQVMKVDYVRVYQRKQTHRAPGRLLTAGQRIASRRLAR